MRSSVPPTPAPPETTISSQQAMLRSVATTMAAARMETRIVRGREQVLALSDLLLDLSRRYGQAGAMTHLEYFLSFSDSLRKTPCVVLMGRDMGRTGETVEAAVLLYEHRVAGFGLKIFATDDVSGRRTLLAPEGARLVFAKLAAKALMETGARAVVQSFADGELSADAVAPRVARPKKVVWAYTVQSRLTRSHLRLESTLAATFALIGQKTRFNMRYYRRRAEAQLGCVFVEQVRMEREEFLAMNLICAYPVPDELAGWRYDSIARYAGMFLCGLRDRDGRWLSLVGGRHYENMAEIDWQMNRTDLPEYSLSVVMRAFLIEHEIGRGSVRLYIEGGTPQFMRFSLATHVVHDLVVVRSSWLLRLMRKTVPVMLKLVNRYLPKSNQALRLLTDPKILWRPWV